MEKCATTKNQKERKLLFFQKYLLFLLRGLISVEASVTARLVVVGVVVAAVAANSLLSLSTLLLGPLLRLLLLRRERLLEAIFVDERLQRLRAWKRASLAALISGLLALGVG